MWISSTAAAIELIHTYSLIHDDLPAMDDDDLRRGRPTSHVKYGEDVAILAGDALFAEAIRLIAERQRDEPARVLGAIRAIAAATGVDGMVGGQYVDVTGGGTDAASLRELVDDYLDGLRFSSLDATFGLEEAMRYSLLAGGKRIRPVLALATARSIGLELSLIHI